MENFDIVVINGVVTTATDTAKYDIGIKNGKIAALALPGLLSNAVRVIDAKGGLITPGGVDCHVHLEEPALFGGKGRSSDNFETGTRSAVAGGTTTIVAFAPQTKSDESVLEVIETAQAKANGSCYSDYSFHLLLSNPTPNVLSEFALLPKRGITSLKLYMTYPTLQLRDDQILKTLLASREAGLTTLIHAENGDILTFLTDQLTSRGHVTPKFHATSRPQPLESEATYRAITLAQLMDTPILLVHVSSPLAAAHIRRAQTEGLPIYGETCPQYLFLTRADLATDGFSGAKCVCSPPPRESANDHDALWRGLANGTFTILSSDHCPFMYEDTDTGKKSAISKDHPEGRFDLIPNGCPGVETRLPLILSANKLSVQKFVEVCCTNPAKLYGLYPRKGAILPGVSDADLTIWYPPVGEAGALNEFDLSNSMLHHNVDYTPFQGRKLRQWPRYTILRGQVVWDRENGGIIGERGYGQFVEREKSCLAGPLKEGEWDVSSL